MLNPYYQDEFATIYHGDCREILPHLEPVDLVLTDPPYGINAARDRNSQKHGWVDYPCGGWDKARPDKEVFDMVLSKGKRIVIWGGNYFADMLPASSMWLIWDKGQFDFSLADAELAWCSWAGAVRRKIYARSAALKDGKQYATQKPLEVMRWCLNFAPDAQIVLDPFVGSGTTLRAAKDAGIKSIGIDIQERACEIAAKRLRQEVLWSAMVK